MALNPSAPRRLGQSGALLRSISRKSPFLAIQFNSDLEAETLNGAHAHRARAAPTPLGCATAAKSSCELLSDGLFVVFPEPVELGDQLFTLVVGVGERVAGTLP